MSKKLNFLPPRLMAVLIAGSLATSFETHAAVETLTEPVISIPLTDTDYSNPSFGVQQFDGSLGTLVSVMIKATGTGVFSQFFQNRSTTTLGSVTISQTFDIILNTPAGTSLDLNKTEIHTYSSVPTYNGTDPFFGGTSSHSENYTVTAENSATMTTGLNPFIGSQIVNFGVNATGSGNATINSGNFIVGWSTLAGLDVAVSYNYLPNQIAVPEPATWMAGIFTLTCVPFVFYRKPQKRGA
jgi:hypothetical protein